MKMNRKSIGLLAMLAFFSSSCKDEAENVEKEKSPSNLEQLHDFILEMEDPLQESVVSEKESIGDVIAEFDEATMTYCKSEKIKLGAEFNESMLLDPSSNVIYPGSIIDGNSVVTGAYRQIVLNRAPLTISTNLPYFDGNPSCVVENPSLSTVRDATKKLVYDSDITGSTPATITFEKSEVFSEEQLNLAIGVGANVMDKVKVSSNFDFSEKNTNSKVLIKFQQVYYTIDVDAPSSPSGFFADDVTVQDLKDAVGGGNTVPVYVSSVKYGRVAYFCIESSESAKEIIQQFDASVDVNKVNLNVSDSLRNNEILKSSKITGTVIGGAASEATKTISGLEAMVDYIKSGGNFSKESPGAPIAYTLTKLSTNEVFGVVSNTEYVARRCETVDGNVLPLSFYSVKGNNDICGQITIEVEYANGTTSDKIYLYNKSVSRQTALSVKQGETVKLDDVDENGDFYLKDWNLEGAKIHVNAQLYDWDDACQCGTHHEYDTFTPFSTILYYPDDFDANGIATLKGLKMGKEYSSGCEEYRSGKYKHEATYTTSDSEVNFKFKIYIPD